MDFLTPGAPGKSLQPNFLKITGIKVSNAFLALFALFLLGCAACFSKGASSGEWSVILNCAVII